MSESNIPPCMEIRLTIPLGAEITIKFPEPAHQPDDDLVVVPREAIDPTPFWKRRVSADR